jgi:AraC family transcriptional regulator
MATLASALSVIAPGPAQIMESSSSVAWQGILLEKHISSPFERKPASIDHNVITMLCSPFSTCGTPAVRRKRGALAIYPAGPVDSARLNTTCELLHCALEKNFIRGVMEEMALPQSQSLGMRFHLGLADIPIARLLMLLMQELEAGTPSGKLYADSLIQALAIRFVLLDSKQPARLCERHALGPSSESSLQASPLPQRVLRRVKDRIEAELAGDLSLSILAEESGYSRTHFQRMFRAATGLTPHQYLLERRIRRAQDLLEKRNLSFTDIAVSCGFSSHSHMTTIFRKLLGMTPGEYRRHLSQRP